VTQYLEHPLGILPLGRVEGEMIQAVAGAFAGEIGMALRVMPGLESPDYAFDRHRIQYDAARIISRIEAMDIDGCARVMALVDVDLFVPVFTFVFGEARLGGRVALVSLFRLEDRPDRAVKIALHEFGHLCMLDHCRESRCVMNFAKGLGQLDRVPPYYCRYCLGQVTYMAGR
jgi:archaemetzincin